jgi:predicted nuclease of predicted toxin-antitoxin system
MSATWSSYSPPTRRSSPSRGMRISWFVTADSDFAARLALAAADGPSVVQLRGVAELPPADHLQLLVDNLSTVADDLGEGAVVSLSPTRLAVRRLPIR